MVEKSNGVVLEGEFEIVVDDEFDDVNEIETSKIITLNSVLKNDLKMYGNSSIQPNVLLRAPVFTPVGRKTKNAYSKLDLSAPLRNLDICRKEGYDKIVLGGLKLNIETDFKVWCGVLLSFSKLGESSNKITLGFCEFAANCGYPTRRFDAKLRQQIDNSLGRIKSQTLSLYHAKQVDTLHTGLLLSAELKESQDLIILHADEKLWDLYQIDHQVVVNLNVLKQLPRAEVAQCLYLYFVALPQKPFPISFARMRARLQLASCDKESNRLIRSAIKKLESVGFISGSFVKKNDDNYYLIHSRRKNLKAMKKNDMNDDA